LAPITPARRLPYFALHGVEHQYCDGVHDDVKQNLDAPLPVYYVDITRPEPLRPSLPPAVRGLEIPPCRASRKTAPAALTNS